MITIDSINTDVKKVIAEALNLNLNDINNELEYRSISEWDSLGHVNILLSLEYNFNIVIQDEDRDQLTDVLKITNYIASIRDFNIKEKEEKTFDDEKDTIYRGLANINFDTTKISSIDGKNGELLYRGISISELIEKSSFEEVSYLLIYGNLPSEKQLEGYKTRLFEATVIPEEILPIIPLLKNLRPIDYLRTIISVLGGITRSEDNEKNLIDVLAKVPLLIASQVACRNNKELMKPDPKLSYAANFLYMLKGEKPTLKESKIFDRILILHADHGSNASAFAARVAIGTEADLYSALTSAISTFSGELHGGAIEKVLDMVEEIGSRNNVEHYVQEKMKLNKPIMGFGHRIYKTEDPRAVHLKRILEEIHITNNRNTYEILTKLVEVMRPYMDKGMNINVDFYASAIYESLNIPKDIYISLFSMGRLPGWLAQIMEQRNNNILIRPVMRYIGERKNYIPIEER